MIVTSFSGSRPTFLSITRVAMSEDEPTLDTPIFLPLIWSTPVIAAGAMNTNG